MFNYTLYNLKISSEVELSGLEKFCGDSSICDLKITLGDAPQKLGCPPLLKRPCTEMAENEFIFSAEKLGARFYLRNGDEIIVDKNCFKDNRAVSMHLLGSVMGAALYMRDHIPMHASAVLTERGAVLFVGKSGVGKSTTACALRQKGYKVITDDVAPISLDSGRAHVLTGPSQLKLWEDSISMTGIDDLEKIRIRDAFNKYYINTTDKLEKDRYPVFKIICLAACNHSGFKLEENNNANGKVNFLKNNTYRRAYVDGLNRRRQHFQTMVTLARLPMVRFTRTHNKGDFSAFISKVEEVILK